MFNENKQKIIDQLVEKANGEFTAEEVDNFVNIGGKLAAKSVLCALQETLREEQSAEAESLIYQIEELKPYPDAGCVSLEMEVAGRKHTLNIALSLVSRDYYATVDIPSDNYAMEVLKQLHFLKQTAFGYWNQFKELYPALINQIQACRPDIGDLTEDTKNPTTMYFKENSARRVGLFSYYVDEHGRPWYKK